MKYAHNRKETSILEFIQWYKHHIKNYINSQTNLWYQNRKRVTIRSLSTVRVFVIFYFNFQQCSVRLWNQTKCRMFVLNHKSKNFRVNLWHIFFLILKIFLFFTREDEYFRNFGNFETFFMSRWKFEINFDLWLIFHLTSVHWWIKIIVTMTSNLNSFLDAESTHSGCCRGRASGKSSYTNDEDYSYFPPCCLSANFSLVSGFFLPCHE